jgi:hypothetical protein
VFVLTFFSWWQCKLADTLKWQDHVDDDEAVELAELCLLQLLCLCLVHVVEFPEILLVLVSVDPSCMRRFSSAKCVLAAGHMT